MTYYQDGLARRLRRIKTDYKTIKNSDQIALMEAADFLERLTALVAKDLEGKCFCNQSGYQQRCRKCEASKLLYNLP